MTGSMIIRSLTLIRSDHHDYGVYRIQHVQSHRSHHADDDNLAIGAEYPSISNSGRIVDTGKI
jgi:hypothetical protein